MQVTQPDTIRDKIKTMMAKYIAEADSWGTVSAIKTNTELLID